VTEEQVPYEGDVTKRQVLEYLIRAIGEVRKEAEQRRTVWAAEHPEWWPAVDAVAEEKVRQLAAAYSAVERLAK
jgi:hypothetical protein